MQTCLGINLVHLIFSPKGPHLHLLCIGPAPLLKYILGLLWRKKDRTETRSKTKPSDTANLGSSTRLPWAWSTEPEVSEHRSHIANISRPLIRQLSRILGPLGRMARGLQQAAGTLRKKMAKMKKFKTNTNGGEVSNHIKNKLSILCVNHKNLR